MKVYFRVAEAIGPTLAQAFDDLHVRTETVLTGEVVDDAALHGLIARCRDLGIAILDMRVEGREDATFGGRFPFGATVADGLVVEEGT